MLIDAEWGVLSAEEIEEKIQDDLNENGWEGRSAVVVIDPELEIWVWSTSPHVPSLFGTDWETIKNLGYQTGHWQEGETKPSRPKELLVEVLRRTRNKVFRRAISTIGRKSELERVPRRVLSVASVKFCKGGFPHKDRHLKRRI